MISLKFSLIAIFSSSFVIAKSSIKANYSLLISIMFNFRKTAPFSNLLITKESKFANKLFTNKNFSSSPKNSSTKKTLKVFTNSNSSFPKSSIFSNSSIIQAIYSIISIFPASYSSKGAKSLSLIKKYSTKKNCSPNSIPPKLSSKIEKKK